MRQRTRTRTPEPTIASPGACLCTPKAYVIATFRRSILTTVTRMHNRVNRDGSECGLAPEPLNPAEWLRGKA